MRDGDESADVQVVNAVEHLRIRRRIGGGEAAVVSGEQHLAHFFLEAHVAQRIFHPLGLFRRQLHGGRLLIRANVATLCGTFRRLCAAAVLSSFQCYREHKQNRQNNWSGVPPSHVEKVPRPLRPVL